MDFKERERERERPDGDAKMRPLLLLVTALLGKAHLECCNSVIQKVGDMYVSLYIKFRFYCIYIPLILSSPLGIIFTDTISHSD